MSVLKGIKVLDFSRILAAPIASMLLGDAGAAVYKIEQLNGEETRRWAPPWTPNGQSCYFLTANRNKQSVAINLAASGGRELARRLADRCDVLIENFKVGTMERWGLDYNTLIKSNPRLVYCSITGRNFIVSSS